MTGGGRGAELADALEGAVGAGPVTGLRRLSGGASRDTWSFAAGERPLILQRARSGGCSAVAA